MACTEEHVVLVLNAGPLGDFSFLEEHPGNKGLAIITHEFTIAPLHQARLDLGVLNLQNSVDEVRKILQQCRPRFMTSHSTGAEARSAWQDCADWTEI